MNFGEMLEITRKYNQITGASQTHRVKRLTDLRKNTMKSHLKEPNQYKARFIMMLEESLLDSIDNS